MVNVADTKFKAAVKLQEGETRDSNAEAYECREKLKGQFRLLLNHQLPMPKKIEKFGADPVVFYLHKARNFIRKLEVSKVESERYKEETKLKNEKVMEELREKKVA